MGFLGDPAGQDRVVSDVDKERIVHAAHGGGHVAALTSPAQVAERHRIEVEAELVDQSEQIEDVMVHHCHDPKTIFPIELWFGDDIAYLRPCGYRRLAKLFDAFDDKVMVFEA